MKSKVIAMREARKEAGKTLEEVAAAAKISYSAARALEIGIGRNYSAAVKHSVSDFLGVPFFSMWPEEREKLHGLIKELRPTHHRLEMLKDYLPEIKFRNDAAADKVLEAATLEELDEIFHSGVSIEEAFGVLTVLAKKYHLPVPQI